MQDALAAEILPTSCPFLLAADELGHRNFCRATGELLITATLCRPGLSWRLCAAIPHFEYSSTMSCSLIGGVCTSSRFGRATTLALKCSRSCSSHGTALWLCATLRASSTMAF